MYHINIIESICVGNGAFYMKRISHQIMNLLCVLMLFVLIGCGVSEGNAADNKAPDKDIVEEENVGDVEVPELSDELLVGISYGGSGWGDFYECLSAQVVICKNRDVIIFMPTKVEYYQAVEIGPVGTLTLSEEQYSNIEEGVDLEKIYKLDPKEDRDVCDGDTTYIYLYNEEEGIAKACGGYMPQNSYFNESYKLIIENLPTDEINRIRKDQINILKYQDEYPDYDENLVFTYYSEDESVYIRQDYNTDKSYIVDGDLEIPVDISMGGYAPLISKVDVDGDGQDEYVISECEGTGTGYSVYGLCIVEENRGRYELTRYDGDFFAEVLEEVIEYTYDAGKHEVTFSVKYSDAPPYVVPLERKENLEKVVWSDIIRIRLVDGMPYLSAPSGYVFEDVPVPDYEQAVEVSAPIIITRFGDIDFGEFSLSEDDGIKTP